uniref:DNA packaging protein n=1 Tax=uncultured marine virus TaxID=186617 RepID=A0A0F7L809_9VIRU|nr:DNA packaging protein [uncultured marine virus]
MQYGGQYGSHLRHLKACPKWCCVLSTHPPRMLTALSIAASSIWRSTRSTTTLMKTNGRSSLPTLTMSGRLAPKASHCWAPAGSFQSRRKALGSTYRIASVLVSLSGSNISPPLILANGTIPPLASG